jgi:hypothetical protein
VAARRIVPNRRYLLRRFRELADQIKKPVVRSFLDNLFATRPHDPEQERAYVEHVLHTQMEEWTQESEQQQDEGFHYARAAGFDHQP